jgi:hypothetical protein
MALEKADAVVYYSCVEITLSSQRSGDGELTVVLFSDFLTSQLELLTSTLPPFPMLEELYIYEYFHRREVLYLAVGDDNWNTLWLDFLRLFSSVKDLYISKQFAFDVVRAMQELIGDRTTEVLPALRNLFLEDEGPCGSVEKGVQQFAVARRLSGHPVDVSHWVRTRCKDGDD